MILRIYIPTVYILTYIYTFCSRDLPCHAQQQDWPVIIPFQHFRQHYLFHATFASQFHVHVYIDDSARATPEAGNNYRHL